ncbi:WhiB family transcriptional regulator [Mycobacterium sp.]|uniref:WhiB family transcriptional regulator n=1 Tax=Mycobacterium sp. TaxID=1785 RepID=UPI002CB70BEC|nr:WhiB family transcriptional regulator [Mycobacterium sp.]HTY35391.1 WhiB family transcriptional regulator [Mycobacterium sp.]
MSTAILGRSLPQRRPVGDREWMVRAACRRVDPRWFSMDRFTHDRSIRGTNRCRVNCQLCRAIRICHACPVIADCRAYIEATEPTERILRDGVWAATTPGQRHAAWEATRTATDVAS